MASFAFQSSLIVGVPTILLSLFRFACHTDLVLSCRNNRLWHFLDMPIASLDAYLHAFGFGSEFSPNVFFCQESIDYIGHIVSSRGVQAYPNKVEAMVRWPLPINVKQLRSFLGLTGYYRRFISGYASMISLLKLMLLMLALKLQASSVYIKELYAITEAVLKWCQILLGHFFVIRTDHSTIKELL
ncbi:putative mitochondrial protein, partial [Mucuna pruriens]